MSEPSRPSLKKKRKRVTKVYVCHKGEKLGPFSRLEVGRALASGDFKLSDLAWYNRLTQWVPLEQLPPNTDEGPLFPMPALPPGVAGSAGSTGAAGEEASSEGKRRRRTTSTKKKGWGSRILDFFGK